MDDATRTLEAALTRARSRLRARGALGGAAIGAQVGAWLAVAAVVALRLSGILSLPGTAVAALLLVSVAAAVGAAIGAARSPLDRRSLALLVDRLGGTEELLLTALHVAGTDDPNREEILGRLRRAEVPDPAARLPLRVPRHLRFAAVPVALALLLSFLPALDLARPTGHGDPVAEAGERLEERLQELRSEDGVELPPEIEREVAALAEDLQADPMGAEEALQRLEQLQQQLERFEESLAGSGDLLEDLESAAKALDEQATEALAEALEEGDLERAAEAAQDLEQSLAEATPEERQRAAEALQEAGERLKGSQDPNLRDMGEAMERAGEQLGGEQAPQGQAGQPGSPGADGNTANGGGDPTPGGAPRELAEQLARNQELGQRLARDRQALERAQQLAGATERSRQELGGDPRVAQGESQPGQQPGQQPGEDPQAGDGTKPGRGTQPGQGAGDGQESGDGQGSGPGQGGEGASGTSAGDGHTWEDEGERPGGAQGPQQDRNSDRAGGQHIDDFEKLYEAVRLEGAQALLAGVDGQIDERGRVDELSVRVTEAEEAAKVGRVDLPATYRDEAAEAIEAEPIPPAYKEAVKRYFDSME